MSQDITSLQDIIKRFCQERDWDPFHNPIDLAIGLSTESNELLDIFCFKSIEQMEEIMKDEKSKERVAEELGDVFYFLIRFVQMNQFDLEKCLRE